MRFTNTLVTLASAAAAAGLLAACGSSAASSGSPGGAASPTTAAAASAWTPGGAFTGPVPPANGLLGTTNTWHLKPYTSPEGYVVQDDVVVGVPLHFAIPSAMVNCYIVQGTTQDLPPGQYVVPFEIVVHNHTGQQAKVITPGFWAGDASGNATIDVTSGDRNGNDTNGLFANGDCNSQVYHMMNAGGSDAIYGFIGPATVAQLSATTMYVDWTGGENNVPGTPPTLSLPLTQLLPHAGTSWLVAHGGTAQQPQAAPSAVPQACPSAPAGLTSDEQTNFNGVCGVWITQVPSMTSQFNDNGKLSPGQTADAYCTYYDNLGSTDNSGLHHACRLAIAAAGGPAANAS